MGERHRERLKEREQAWETESRRQERVTETDECVQKPERVAERHTETRAHRQAGKKRQRGLK